MLACVSSVRRVGAVSSPLPCLGSALGRRRRRMWRERGEGCNLLEHDIPPTYMHTGTQEHAHARLPTVPF